MRSRNNDRGAAPGAHHNEPNRVPPHGAQYRQVRMPANSRTLVDQLRDGGEGHGGRRCAARDAGREAGGRIDQQAAARAIGRAGFAHCGEYPYYKQRL